MSSKGDYKAFRPTIERILKQAKQEIDLEKRIKPNSSEHKNAIKKRALELAEVEKQRLSRKFNVKTSNEFYRLFELDLKDFVEKTGLTWHRNLLMHA